MSNQKLKNDWWLLWVLAAYVGLFLTIYLK